MSWSVHHGDCVEWLRTLPANSLDGSVTDPPYGLGRDYNGPELGRILRGFRAAGKPIGAVCIAPAVLVLALGEGHVTIGDDAGTAAAIESFGGEHESCPVEEMVVDRERRIVTAPAYMYDAPIKDIASGIETLVEEITRLCGD